MSEPKPGSVARLTTSHSIMRMIVRCPRAEDDLIEVWLYIAGDNEAAADRALQKIDRSLKTLADHPNAGGCGRNCCLLCAAFQSEITLSFTSPMAEGIEVVRVLSRYLDIQPEDMH